jgi:hypothetical protein
MQIHELTKPQLDEGLGSALGKIGGGISNIANRVVGAVSPVGGAKDAYTSAVRPQQIKMLSDKVYTVWKQYEKTLLQSNPDARETPMYEQALLAFVTKNLLGGQYLPNVINKKQIMDLVKQLSGTDSVNEADVTTEAGIPGNVPVEKIPGKKDLLKGTTPPAASSTTPPAAMTPQKEKDLWLKLTQQAAVAQAQAPGTASQSAQKSATPGAQSGAGVSDARTYAQQLKPTDPAIANGLAAFGNASAKTIGDTTVTSTGNPVADALLILAGFRGL